MQPSQIEHLKQLINTSPALTPPEKAEWLDMLILMNDKQASELEEILKAHHGSLPQKPTGPMPPLSHISNLPAGVPRTQQRPQSSAQPAPPPQKVSPNLPSASTMPWQKQFQAAMTEKELPPPNPAQALHAKSFIASAPVAPRPKATVSKAPSPTSGKAPVLETIADAGKLTLSAMRQMALPDLLIRLQQLSKIEGYFNLLSFLEDSPLYKNYINTGKKVLGNQLTFGQPDAGELTMTKQEFEAFADILRKIQLN